MTAKILCIEDNPQNMRLVRKILLHAGYEVLEAADGLGGVNMAIETVPDLILMDINLPDIDGLEATNRIKAHPTTSHIPVVALTANAMYGDEARILSGGCDGYMSKPVTKTVLINTINRFLNDKTD